MRDKNKRRQNRCYYIRLNNIDLVEFDKRGLENLLDFIELNLFTSNFACVGDLINYLREEHFIEEDYEVEEIDIVKRVKVEEDTTYYRYYRISDEPLFRDAKRFFSTIVVRRFFELNFFEYDAIKYIVRTHLDIFESFLNRMNIEKKPIGVQSKYRQRLANMQILLEMIDNLQQGFMNYLDEYSKRLNEFYDSEMLYTKDNTATVNYRGLMELAKTIDDATKRFDNLVIPRIDNKENYNKNPRKEYSSPLVEDEVDPDNYVYLENEDFERLLNENSKQNEIDSVEDQILNNESKKSRL